MGFIQPSDKVLSGELTLLAVLDKIQNDCTVATSSDVIGQWGGVYWVRISVPVPIQSGFLQAQRVDAKPLHPLLSR